MCGDVCIRNRNLPIGKTLHPPQWVKEDWDALLLEEDSGEMMMMMMISFVMMILSLS